MEKTNKDVEAEVDHFQSLPDELVVRIFDKVSEAKWLCMCYLVSSRFASLVLQTGTVTFKIPGWRFRESLSPQTHSLVLSMVNNFLRKFVRIKSLHVEVLFDESADLSIYDHFLIRWKATASRKNLIFIAAKRDRTRVNSDDQHEVGASSNTNQYEIYSNIAKRLYGCAEDPNSRYWMLKSIIGAFPYLKEAVVKDSFNEGLLLVGEDDLDVMRSSVANGNFFVGASNMWIQRVLKLPSSGLVMEDVMLMIVNPIEDADVSIAENAFVEKELCEAVTEVLKKKPHYIPNYENLQL